MKIDAALLQVVLSSKIASLWVPCHISAATDLILSPYGTKPDSWLHLRKSKNSFTLCANPLSLPLTFYVNKKKFNPSFLAYMHSRQACTTYAVSKIRQCRNNPQGQPG
jgi:hypothetical protein